MRSKITKFISNVYIFSGCFLLIISACNNADYSQQYSMVDSLNIRLDSTDAIKDLDPEYYEMLVDSVKKDMNFVADYYPDSLSIDQALTMDYYKTIKKKGGIFVEAYPVLVTETESLRKQLSGLKGSLKSGEMSLDSFNYYYAIEKEDVERQMEQYHKVVDPILQINVWKDSIMQEAQIVIEKSRAIKAKQENK